MLGKDNILNQLFTPFYFLSPHLYVEMLNEKLPNQCFTIFKFNTTTEDDTQDIENNEFNIAGKIQNKVENNIIKESKLDSIKTTTYKKHRKKITKDERRISYFKLANKKRILENEGTNETNSKNETSDEEEEEELDPLEEMYQRIVDEPYFDIKFRGHLLYRLDRSNLQRHHVLIHHPSFSNSNTPNLSYSFVFRLDVLLQTSLICL